MAEELNGNGHSMTWKMSPSIGKLFEALAKAQLKFDPVLKDSANPAYHSKYADLASVIGATQPHLAAEGLALIQMPQAEFGAEDAKILTLTTLMGHSSGEWISSDLKLPAMMRERFDAQSVGSAITYARRYSWSAMTGVAQEDDDGNSASGMGTKEAARAVADHKLRNASKTSDRAEVVLSEWSDGWVALSGNGLPIVKAEVAPEVLQTLNFRRDGQTVLLPVAKAFPFIDLCKRANVEARWNGAATTAPSPDMTTLLEKSVAAVESGKKKNGKADPA